MMKILYFGRLSDTLGRREEMIPFSKDIANLEALRNWLDKTHDLNGCLHDPAVKIMVNQSLVHNNIKLAGDEEIGFLPPVGGG